MNKFTYLVTSYSMNNLYNKIKEAKITTLRITKINQYQYEVEIPYLQNKKFIQNFKDIKLISKKGFLFIILDSLNKLTIISIILSVVLFIFLSTLIYKIEINGESKIITNNIYLICEKYQIKKYRKLPSKEVLSKIKSETMSLYNQIENMELLVKGSTLNINYFLKEKEIVNNKIFGKYYAEKDGIIKYVDIESGLFMSKDNAYVKKGDLLISDYLLINQKNVYLGGYGKVYAYTWATIELKKESKIDEVETYSSLLSEARYLISKNFEENEYIEEEKILNFTFSKSISFIKIHYTLVENIACLKNN